MPGVTGRADIRVKGPKAIERQMSNKELKNLLNSAKNDKMIKCIADDAIAAASAVTEAKMKANTDKIKSTAVKAAMKSTGTIDDKLKSIRFVEENVNRAGTLKADSKSKTDMKTIPKSKLKTQQQKQQQQQDGSLSALSIRTSIDYSQGDGLGVIASPEPLTPLVVKVPTIQTSAPVPIPATHATHANIDDAAFNNSSSSSSGNPNNEDQISKLLADIDMNK